MSEQLAQQHALVSRLQRTDTDWEQLCAEKIAEQQLRIKQVGHCIATSVLIHTVHVCCAGKDPPEVDGLAVLHPELTPTEQCVSWSPCEEPP